MVAKIPVCFVGVLALASCATPAGEVVFLLEPESSITSGIRAGAELEQVQDGWSVDFSKYLVALGPVELTHVQSGTVTSDPGRWVVDLVQIPQSGEELWRVTAPGEGRSDLRYATEVSESQRHDSVGEEDFERMADQGLTHVIEGTLSSPEGTSCPPTTLAEVPSDADAIGTNSAGDDCYAAPSVSFSISVRAEVTYGPCSIEGLPGVVVAAGDVATAAISMHGDHLFFGGFPEGSEGEVRRYGQWLSDCDLNLDGVVTSEELERIAPADLAEFDERFPLGGSPLRPVDDLLTYVASQLSTQGHFEGEGECAIGFDSLDVP